MIDVNSGTDEAEWESCPTLAGLPLLRLPRLRRAVVVAPHPDDEVLGVGGILRMLASVGWSVELVAVTDGEGSHPGSDRMFAGELRGLRPNESREAIKHLGLALTAEHRLELPDGDVASHHGPLVRRLTALLSLETLVLATWRNDGHPDHEAVGRASAEAARVVGARMVEYPVWMWNWASPGDLRVPWRRARVFPLDCEARAAKARAIGAFRSQLVSHGPSPADGPVLPTALLAHFARPFEVVLN